MKNKLPNWFKSLLSVSIILICFLISSFFLKHAFYYSILDEKLGRKL